MSRHRTFEAGRHRRPGRASRLATWWRLITGRQPHRNPVMPAAELLASLYRPPAVPPRRRSRPTETTACGVVATYPRTTSHRERAAA